MLHILAVIPFGILGALQVARGFRRRHRAWHRAAGRVLAVAGLVAALTGLWMARFYPWPAGDGFALYVERLIVGSAMTLSIVLALFAIRRRDFAAHGAWMMRGYALGVGAGTQVLTHMPWILLVGKPGELARAVLMGAGWGINVVFAEWVIRRRRASRLTGRAHARSDLPAGRLHLAPLLRQPGGRSVVRHFPGRARDAGRRRREQPRRDGVHRWRCWGVRDPLVHAPGRSAALRPRDACERGGRNGAARARALARGLPLGERAALKPDLAAIARLDRTGVVVTAPGDAGYDCVSRYFAPLKGVPEDPVTGGAHCMLGPFWAAQLGKTEIRAWQASARGGALLCRVRGDRVELEGACVFYLEGQIELDEV